MHRRAATERTARAGGVVHCVPRFVRGTASHSTDTRPQQGLCLGWLISPWAFSREAHLRLSRARGPRLPGLGRRGGAQDTRTRGRAHAHAHAVIPPTPEDRALIPMAPAQPQIQLPGQGPPRVERHRRAGRQRWAILQYCREPPFLSSPFLSFPLSHYGRATPQVGRCEGRHRGRGCARTTRASLGAAPAAHRACSRHATPCSPTPTLARSRSRSRGGGGARCPFCCCCAPSLAFLRLRG
ncbi:hypothetical protein BC628DRAFT_916061 [Trametes gibbosa]|nr:hypothetical protein BC628DRAFT_916061 [Trametes gibbosa]